MKLICIVTTLLTTSLAPIGLKAAIISITNAGFEEPSTTTFTTPIPGWTITGASRGGVWNIDAYPNGYWTGSAPEGSQIGYASGTDNGGGPASLSQVLSASLTPDTIYTLSAQVGHPLGFGASIGTAFTIELLAGASVLASRTDTGPEGAFTPFSIAFDSTGSSLIGQPLQIRLSSSQAQTGFDALTLNATPTPEPGAAVLLLFGACFCLRQRFRSPTATRA